MLALEFRYAFVNADAGRHRKRADIIGHAAFFGRDEIAEAQVGLVFRLDHLLAQVVPGHCHLAARFIRVNFDVVAIDTVCRKQAKHSVCT